MNSTFRRIGAASLAALITAILALCIPGFSYGLTQYSGEFECNTAATWSLSSSGALRIEGAGAIGADEALYNVSGEVNSVSIGNGITSIGFETFCYFTNLQAVTFDEESKLTTIEGFAFNNCQSLRRITIPAAVTSIGNSAFAGCYALTSATTEDESALTSIGASAFSNCTSLKNAVTGSRLKTIGSYAFNGCSSIASAVIPKTVTSVGKGAFNNCTNLSKVTVLNPSKTKIASSAFNGTKVKSKANAKKITVKKVRRSGKGKLKVTWSKVTGAKKYVVYYKKAGAKKYKHVTVKGSTKRSVTLKKLKKGKRYVIYVKAKGKSKTICTSKKKKSGKVK